MKILLIQPPHYYNGKSRPPNLVPLGLGYIGKVLLNQGHDVEILDIWAHQWTHEEVLKQIRNLEYDIAGISAISTQYAYVKWLIVELKKHNSGKIMVGGALATFSPEIILENTLADICVIGEGEITVKEICENIENLNAVKGIFFNYNGQIIRNPPREYINDLDTIEFPALELFPMDIYLKNCSVFAHPEISALGVITSRGCPYNCNYCSKTFKNVRYRSIDNVIKEIKLLKDKYGIKGVFFLDELAIANKNRSIELCDKLGLLGLNWNCQSRVNTIDSEILKRMKQAGCLAVGFGVESGSQTILNNMNKRQTISQSNEAILMTVKEGLLPIIQMMYGYPGENESTLRENVDFFNKLPYLGYQGISTAINFSPTTALPGSELYDQAKKQKIIRNEDEYLSSLEGGYLTDAGRLLINFTEFNEDEYSQYKKKMEKEIYNNHIKKYPFHFMKDYSFMLLKNFLPYLRENGLKQTTKRIVEKVFIHEKV